MPSPLPPAGNAADRLPVLFAHWGHEGIRGSERVLLDLLGALDRDAFDPLVWCNARTMEGAVRELGIPVRVSAMPILLGWDAPRFDIGGYRRLIGEGRRLIAEHGARVVHANSGAPNQWLVPAARRARVPLVAHLHAVYGLRERCTLLLHQAPMIVGCSGAVIEPFRRDHVPESRLRVIHNGVSPERLAMGDASALRAELGLGPSDVLVAGFGALVPLKGFDLLLRAIALLRDRGIAAHALVAGEGPERDALAALARELGVAERAHFVGHRGDVGAVLRDAADIAAVPSRVESFGLVAAEAGAVGRPAVGTTVGGIPELIVDGETGALVPPDDPAALADALARLVADRALRERMGAAARARVLAGFTTQMMTRRFESLYRDLASAPAASYGWTRQGVRLAPFARLGFGVVGRRLRGRW